MKNKLLIPLFFVGVLSAYSQSQVGIGTRTPNASSQLEIVSNNKGVLFPQVSLTSTTDITTITTGNVNSLFVYNSNTLNDVTPGYYYWLNNKWLRFASKEDVKAESGVEIHDDKLKLGGNLTRTTTITQNGNPFTIATGGSNLNITGLDKTKVQATVNSGTGVTDYLLAVGTNDKVKALKAAMPKFFYMPSVLVPTAESQVATGQTNITYNNTSRTGTINLYNIYVEQFGSPVMSSSGAAALPVLPASELGFHITYATQGVFTINSITAAGLMTYTVSATADITNGSFINIVFSVNED